ncbi:hypothetical protein [Mumia quercus]|uniref:hypothetical protein n=1 Tax=Mumia quercus TaxID=2976125 RepID=UPI0021CFC303|nr:hypothetical protein [Mumia quercus]
MSDRYERLQTSRGARIVIPVLGAVLLVAGLSAPPVLAIPALVVLVLFVGWLALRSPVHGARLDRVRLLVLGVLVALLVGRVAGALDLI